MDKRGKTNKRTKRERPLSPSRAGWSIPEYFPGVTGFGGRVTFYVLPEEAKPRYIRIGCKITIIEPGPEYLHRLAQLSAKTPIQFRRAA